MKALVVGFGSIGARHARLLADLGLDVAVVSRRPQALTTFASLEEGLSRHRPEYIVIANETAQHFAAMRELAGAGYRGAVLMEKPLFHTRLEAPAHEFSALFVAYNLRFHPLIERFRSIVSNEKVFAVSAYVGQHLSSWREGDYRLGYSASRERGGGVLLDLSHEIDYLLWILGGWSALTASGGRLGDLEATSDDAYSLIMRTTACALVSLQMNCLHRPARRTLTLVCSRSSYEMDLQGSVMTVNGQTEALPSDRDFTYREQHRALLDGRHDRLCTEGEALEVLRVIGAAERSCREMVWVRRS